MQRRTARRITRPLSDADREKYRRIREQVEAEKPELMEMARRAKAARDRALAPLLEAFAALKAQREAQGLSLADVQERTGISRGALSRLENAIDPNPTLATLLRVAHALGKEIRITLVDAPPDAQLTLPARR